MIWGTLLSWGARALPFLKSPKVLASGVGLLAAGLLWWYVGSLQNKVEELTEDRQMFMMWYQEAAERNASLEATIRQLQGANKILADSVRVKDDERIAAIEAAAERELEAKLKLDDTLDTLQELQNESISCNDLMEVEFAAVCPLTDQRLREHSASPFTQD